MLKDIMAFVCACGIFFGFLLLDSYTLAGAIISLVSVCIFFLMEKFMLWEE